MIDAHIHVDSGPDDPHPFCQRLDDAGIEQAILLSRPPAGYLPHGTQLSPETRLSELLEWCRNPRLHPFFWIDPIADDAADQIDRAVENGVRGFKVICDRFPASHPHAMESFRRMATHEKPILFHAGILWDGKVSSKFNRPIEFECLIEIPGLVFALAHAGWPWCDEAIALYGKFLNAATRNPGAPTEMYVDLTPGTPAVYRADVLRKLCLCGYDIRHNLLWGTDSRTLDYNVLWAREWQRRDHDLLREIGWSDAWIAGVLGGNARRFLGLDPTTIAKTLPRPGR